MPKPLKKSIKCLYSAYNGCIFTNKVDDTKEMRTNIFTLCLSENVTSSCLFMKTDDAG